MGRCNLQVGRQFLQGDVLEDVRTAVQQLHIPLFGGLPAQIDKPFVRGAEQFLSHNMAYVRMLVQKIPNLRNTDDPY